MDIKKWLEQAGEPVGEVCFPVGEAPPLPYIVYLDEVSRMGADTRNLMSVHSLTVERYSNDSEDNPQLEALFDEKALKYEKSKSWLSSEGCYLTVYDLQTNIYDREVL